MKRRTDSWEGDTGRDVHFLENKGSKIKWPFFYLCKCGPLVIFRAWLSCIAEYEHPFKISGEEGVRGHEPDYSWLELALPLSVREKGRWPKQQTAHCPGG